MSMATSSLGLTSQMRVRLIGELVEDWFTRYWIWVVAIMLMVISLGGTEVVLYRLAYMFLFVFFILIFQASSEHGVHEYHSSSFTSRVEVFDRS